jgi:hypothetical protein
LIPASQVKTLQWFTATKQALPCLYPVSTLPELPHPSPLSPSTLRHLSPPWFPELALPCTSAHCSCVALCLAKHDHSPQSRFTRYSFLASSNSYFWGLQLNPSPTPIFLSLSCGTGVCPNNKYHFPTVPTSMVPVQHRIILILNMINHILIILTLILVW